MQVCDDLFVDRARDRMNNGANNSPRCPSLIKLSTRSLLGDLGDLEGLLIQI